MLERPFKIALVISLGMHSAIIAPWPKFNLNLPKRPETQIEVTYFKIEKPPKELPKELPDIKISQEVKKIAPPPAPIEAEKEKVTKKTEPKAAEKSPDEQIPVIVKKTIPKKTIQMTSSPDLEGNISYLSYSQLVREKIRKHLYRNYREFMGEGDVALNFVLKSSGALSSAEVIKEYGAPNKRLRELCITSIRQAAPFRPFPRELLDLAEISFKITISFKSD